MVERETLIALVRGLQNGDENAAAKLYEIYQSDIYYFILKTVNNDKDLAEDLTQDTFVEILETIDKLQEPAAFVTWSKQIAYHKCTAYFRKRKELLVDEDSPLLNRATQGIFPPGSTFKPLTAAAAIKPVTRGSSE